MCDQLLCEIVDRVLENYSPTAPDQPRLRSVLIGDRASVRGRILELHRLRVTEFKSWSQMLPIPNTAEVISIHTERGRREPDILDQAGT